MTSFCKLINKFVGSSNFLAWKRRIDLVLKENEVIDYVNVKVSKPSEGKPLSKYIKKDLRAERILIDSIKDSLIP